MIESEQFLRDGELMGTRTTSRGLTSMLATGVKDLPRNASWLMAKALNPAGNAAGDASASHTLAPRALGRSLADTVRGAGATLREALPVTGSSVELRLHRASDATEQARATEDQALASAELANAKVEAAKRIDRDERERLKELRKEQAHEIELRVAEQRRVADERLEEARAAAERDAEKLIVREMDLADRRVADAREEAERAKQKAEQDLALATEQLAEARRLADDAAAAAEAAAEHANEEAKRLSARAQSGAKERSIVATEAAKLQKANASAADAVARNVSRSRRPAPRSRPRKSARSASTGQRGRNLTSLSRQELVDRARAQNLAGRSEMSKAQLVKALRAHNGKRSR